jgi:hypothetical protein
VLALYITKIKVWASAGLDIRVNGVEFVALAGTSDFEYSFMVILLKYHWLS